MIRPSVADFDFFPLSDQTQTVTIFLLVNIDAASITTHAKVMPIAPLDQHIYPFGTGPVFNVRVRLRVGAVLNENCANSITRPIRLPCFSLFSLSLFLSLTLTLTL
jgi:hypothetical protein